MDNFQELDDYPELPEVDSESSDSDEIIDVVDYEEVPCQPPANNNVSNTADGDDDFCIIYEKYTPSPDIQVLLNYQPPTVPKRSRKTRTQPQQGNSVSLENDTHVSTENATENLNPVSLDDSLCIINEVPPVTVNAPKIHQEANFSSSKSNKRIIRCGICFDAHDEICASGRDLVSTICGHLFCSECIKMSLKTLKQCPQCRKKLTAKQYHPIYI